MKQLIIDQLFNELGKAIFVVIRDRVSWEMRYYIKEKIEEKIRYQTVINIAWKLDNRLERILNEEID